MGISRATSLFILYIDHAVMESYVLKAREGIYRLY